MSCIAPHGMSDQARDALLRITKADVALLGRRNFEGFRGYWSTVADDPAADPGDRQFAAWLNRVRKIVFSHTLQDADWEHATVTTADPVGTVQALRAEAGGEIRVLSSQSVIRQLLAAAEIDRLELMLAPEIVGGGARLFDDTQPTSRWLLARAQPTDTGAVHLTYERQR